MDGISKVLNRIASIEQRFGSSNSIQTSDAFSTALETAEKAYDKGQKNYNSSDIQKMIYIAAKKHGIDPKLAMAVAKTESDLSPDAVSSAGAVGVMQLMPETARELGVRNINDPRENIDAGVSYLKKLLTTFNGDTVKAVAAYNAGPGAVQQYSGVPPYSETQAYVAKVMSLASK